MATGVSGYLPSYYQYNAYYENKYGGMYIRPHYVEEYNVEGNYSVVKIDYIEFRSTMYGHSVGWSISGKININGKEYSYSGSVTTANYSYVKWYCPIVSDPIYHNTDGSKAINISLTSAATASGQVGAQWSNTGTLASTTVALTNIPRASKIQAPSAANIEDEITITVTRYSESFTHTLRYAFGNLTGTIATKITDSVVKWTIPESFYAQIPNATHDTLSLSCTTYSGSTEIGETIWSATVTADPERCKPTLAPVVVDISPETTFLTGDENVLIRYRSDVSISINAQARCSATLKAVNAACGNKSIGEQTGTINDVETGLFTFSATDSRGYTTSTGVTKTIIEYIKPTCNLSVDMPTPAGTTTVKVSGVGFNGSFGAKANTFGLMYRYMGDSGEWQDWHTLTAVFNGHNYTAEGEVTGLDYRQGYTFQARIFDMLETVDSTEKRVKTIPVFDWSENDFNFNCEVNINGDVTTPRLRLTATNDAAIDSTEHPLQIGSDDGYNVIFDGNEIIARNNGEHAQLNLNTDGGDVYIGGALRFGSATQTRENLGAAPAGGNARQVFTNIGGSGDGSVDYNATLLFIDLGAGLYRLSAAGQIKQNTAPSVINYQYGIDSGKLLSVINEQYGKAYTNVIMHKRARAQLFKATGVIETEGLGYGYTLNDGTYWAIARFYTTSGYVGSWDQDLIFNRCGGSGHLEFEVIVKCS
jgi:hypothetical protein